MTQSIRKSSARFLSQIRRPIFGAFLIGLLIQDVAHAQSVWKTPREQEPTAVALGPVLLEGDEFSLKGMRLVLTFEPIAGELVQ